MDKSVMCTYLIKRNAIYYFYPQIPLALVWPFLSSQVRAFLLMSLRCEAAHLTCRAQWLCAGSALLNSDLHSLFFLSAVSVPCCLSLLYIDLRNTVLNKMLIVAISNIASYNYY